MLKIDTTINVGELISITSMLFVIVFFIFKMDARIDVNSQAILNNATQIEQIRQDHLYHNERLLKAIYHLSEKVDRIGERLDGKADRR